MKNLFAFAVVALLCVACVNGNTPLDDEKVTTGKQRVTLTFAPYTTETMAAMAMRAKAVGRRVPKHRNEATKKSRHATALPLISNLPHRILR